MLSFMKLENNDYINAILLKYFIERRLQLFKCDFRQLSVSLNFIQTLFPFVTVHSTHDYLRRPENPRKRSAIEIGMILTSFHATRGCQA